MDGRADVELHLFMTEEHIFEERERERERERRRPCHYPDLNFRHNYTGLKI